MCMSTHIGAWSAWSFCKAGHLAFRAAFKRARVDAGVFGPFQAAKGDRRQREVDILRSEGQFQAGFGSISPGLQEKT